MIETRFKDTEIGKIPEDWGNALVGSFAKVTSGGTPNTSESSYWGGNIPWMNSGELNLKIVKAVEGRITENGLKYSSTKWIPAECVLIGLAGQGKTRGTAAFNTIPLCINQSIGAIHPSDVVDNKFLYYYMNTQYTYLRKISDGGGGRGGLTKSILEGIEIPIPPKSEQTRIATALSKVDALISELDKLIEKKRDIKQGAMQQLLTGKKRLKGFSEPWVEKKLEEIGTLAMCKRIFQEETSESGDVPFYKIGTFGQKADAYITKAKYEQFKSMYRFPNKGDVLISAAGTIGRTVVYDGSPAYFQDSNIVWLAHNENQILNSFLFYVYQRIEWNTENTTIARLYNNNFNNTVVVFPKSLREQSAIASVLTAMDNEISALEAKKAKYKQIKQGMMQQLLTGRIRLVDTVAKTSTANVHFRRSVLAAEIADRLCEEPTFGHVKMEKMLFLTERLCHIDIGSHYHRDAAGPYDNNALRSIDSQLKKQKWFEVRRTEKGNRYVPMQNRGNHKTYFNRYYSDVASTFDKIINTFKTQNTERCEIVATLYSAWEDLQHSNKSFTDADIVNEVLNNWHESKKRISQDRWLSAIHWMRENGFAPNV